MPPEVPRTSSVHQPSAAVAFGVLVLKEGYDVAPRQGQVQSPSPADVAGHLVQLSRAIPAQECLHLAFSPWKEWLGEGERQALMVNPSSGPKLGKAAWRRKQLPCLKFLDHHSQDL